MVRDLEDLELMLGVVADDDEPDAAALDVAKRAVGEVVQAMSDLWFPRKKQSELEDGGDPKVNVSLLEKVLMALYNTGYQAQNAIAQGAIPLDDWRTALYVSLGLPFDATNPILCAIHGALYFVPVLAVVAAAVRGAALVPCAVPCQTA